jgi:hypothetical protein
VCPSGAAAAKAAAGLVTRTLASIAILRIVIFSLLSLSRFFSLAVDH